MRSNSKREARRMVFICTNIVLITSQLVLPTSAILNCLSQNMFKINKDNSGYGTHNWYPSHLPNQISGYSYPGYGSYSQSPMKMLFQPKWKGSSLFGTKPGWSNSWKMGSNSNFYRPNYGYAPMTQIPMSTGGYSNSEHLTNPAQYYLQSPLSTSYASNINDGWSAPLYNQQQVSPIQQTQLYKHATSGYTYVPPKQLQQIVIPSVDYGGTKGSANSKLTSSTTKSYTDLKNQSYGYSYPSWYTGMVESPAKIAQQLMKIGIKNQKILQQQQNQSASLIQESKLTILDEPRFVGYGTLDLLTNKEARLSCSFNEAIDQNNLPLWVKFMGPYNSSKVVDTKIIPPFNCASSNCRTQEIETNKDYRYKFDNGPATSTLIISEPRLSDYGTYRCSALTRTVNNNPLETIYQIVQFGGLS